MPRLSLLALVLLPLVLSCKKDLLHWQQVEQLETQTTTDRFNNIFFTNDSTGYVAGGSRFHKSVVLTTTDGGKTWSYNSFPEAGKALYGIAQGTSGELHIIGYEGKLVSRTDTGWRFTQLPFYLPFKDLALLPGDRAVLIGGISFREGYRISGSNNFQAWIYDSLGYELNDIEMASARLGYIAGYGVVMNTADSAKSWQVQDIEDDNFTSVFALNEQHAWTCGYNGGIFHTSNGGKNWEQLRNGNYLGQPAYRLLDIVFTDVLHGFAVGEKGVVIFTDDGGHHWMEFDRFTAQHLRSIAALKDGSLLICGDGGSLYRLRPKYLQ